MAKSKSFLGSRTSSPSSANDQDFEAALGAISQNQTGHTFSQDISVDRLRPNPFQARQTFDNLEELAESIREQGFVSRLRVRPDPTEDGYFQLVYGERRWRAAKLAGLTQIPCDVAPYTDKQLIEIGLLENIQRQDLNPLEEAQALQRFIEQGNYTIRELAQRIGKNKDYIAGRLALLQAPIEVQELVIAQPQALTSARRIAQIPNREERVSLIEGVLNGKLNTQDVRDAVQSSQKALSLKSARDKNTGELKQLSEIVESITIVRPDVQEDQIQKANNFDEQTKTKYLQKSHNIDVEDGSQIILAILDRWIEGKDTIHPTRLLEALEIVEEKLLEVKKVAAPGMLVG